MFFALEGVDGAGKTTQMRLFCDWIRSEGHEVVECRDPGSTRVGDEIRKILLDSRDTAIDPTTEMLLYMAARAQLVDEVILPALNQHKVVVSDRYLLSNVVYQGHAGGLDPAAIWRVGQIATKGLLPNLSLVLDISDDDAAARMNRPLDRIEQRGSPFRQAVRRGYLIEASEDPQSVVVINAGQDVTSVQLAMRVAAEKVLKRS